MIDARGHTSPSVASTISPWAITPDAEARKESDNINPDLVSPARCERDCLPCQLDLLNRQGNSLVEGGVRS